MSIYGSAVKRPIMTTLCFVAVVILGLFSLNKLPIDLYPDIETNTIMVMTTYTGASAQDIEQNVTRPLENVLNSVSNLKHITSKSRENISVITLEFEYGEDIDVLTNDVRDKLDMVSSMLPDDSETPIIFKFSTDMIPIIMLSVRASESMPGLYKILDDAVANPLARISGVGSVSISGAPKREIHVYTDPQRLEAYGITIEQIASLIGAENRNIPGGAFDIGSDTYSLRVQGEFGSSDEMANIVVGSHEGRSVYLRDVARIDDSLEERTQETYNNGEQGAMIVIQKQSGANSVEISDKVLEMLPTLQKRLPSDVKLGVIVDTSDNIRNTIASLVETVMYALLFVVIVVFFFLGRWRATLIITITIPISLIASFIYLYATGNTLNIVSLSALSISIGMVVDDAIVVLENVTTHIERGSDPRQAAVHGTNEVAVSVIASTLTLIAVFFPLTLVTGMTGVLFRQLGWMVTIMMIISTVCALSLTPMLCSLLLRRVNHHGRLDNGPHIISMNIRLTDPGDRDRRITEIAALMREDLKNFPEFKKVQVSTGGMGMGGQTTLDYEIYGYDFAESDSVARMLQAELLKIPGTADVIISRADYQPEYDIKVMYAPEHRTSLEDIENILLYNNLGQAVRVRDVGRVVERFTPPTIERKDRERIVTVSTVVEGVPMSQVVEQSQVAIDKMDIPQGIAIELAGSYEDQQESFADLMTLAVLIIVLVYIVMAAQFESYTYPGIIMTSLLFAFSGVFIILWLTGHTLNVMSMIGAIMLIGIVVKNGIVLIDYISLNRERGMSIRRAVVNGGESRLRPVVMTTLTTILGMVPMAIGTGQGAEMWRPMGTAVIGGLTFSTILTLLFVPVLYCVFAGQGIKNKRRKLHKLAIKNAKQ